MPRREVRGYAGEYYLAIPAGLNRGPGLELFDIELRHRRLAPGLLKGPCQLISADDDACMSKQRPVHGVVMVGMGQQHIGHVLRLEAARSEPWLEQRPQPERSDINQRNPTVTAQQDDAAPSKPAVANGLARIALDDDVDIVTADLHDPSFSMTRKDRQVFAGPTDTRTPPAGVKPHTRVQPVIPGFMPWIQSFRVLRRLPILESSRQARG